jgi:hypothetical protein
MTDAAPTGTWHARRATLAVALRHALHVACCMLHAVCCPLSSLSFHLHRTLLRIAPHRGPIPMPARVPFVCLLGTADECHSVIPLIPCRKGPTCWRLQIAPHRTDPMLLATGSYDEQAAPCALTRSIQPNSRPSRIPRLS